VHGPPDLDCVRHLPSLLQNRPAAHVASGPNEQVPPTPTVPVHTPLWHLPSSQSACVSHLPPTSLAHWHRPFFVPFSFGSASQFMLTAAVGCTHSDCFEGSQSAPWASGVMHVPL